LFDCAGDFDTVADELSVMLLFVRYLKLQWVG